MRNPIPKRMLAGIKHSNHERVLQWWSALEKTDRRRLATQYSPRWASGRYLPQRKHDQAVTWHRVDTVAYQEDPHSEDSFPTDLYEYFVSNGYDDFTRVRVFHICTAHAKARQVLKRGCIDPNFTCPFNRRSCPMRKLLTLTPTGQPLRIDNSVLALDAPMVALVRDGDSAPRVQLQPITAP